MRTFELWPDPEANRERAYVIDLDSIVLMSEMPSGREWHVEFSSGSYLNLTEDEYDLILAAWKEGERTDAPRAPSDSPPFGAKR